MRAVMLAPSVTVRQECYTCKRYNCKICICKAWRLSWEVTDTPTPTDYGRFWFQARKLVSVIELVIDRRLRRELGMSQTLFLVLSVIEVHPGDFNQQDVADYLATTAATVSRQLDIGARAGYLTVVVSPSSRRRTSSRSRRPARK